MLVTYAIGDVHGALHKLRRLYARCEDHAERRPHRYVFLGDYIDRGPQSPDVIRFLMALQAGMPGDIVALTGNHEALLLAIIDGDDVSVEDWLWQGGGAATLRSYGVEKANELPQDHIAWLRALPLTYDDGRRFFVHAGVNPQLPLNAQNDYDLIWIREPFLTSTRDYGRLIVHGHTPLDGNAPDLRSNRLNLDTGAVFGGPLTAAVFSDAATPPLGFLQVE
jgi:serine/threonine protein phosphatase 1